MDTGQGAASCLNGLLGKHSPELRHGTQFWLLRHLLLNHGSPIFMLFIKTLSCLYDPVKVHKTNILIEPNYKVCSKSFPGDKKRQLWCLPRLGSLSLAAWPRPAPPPPHYTRPILCLDYLPPCPAQHLTFTAELQHHQIQNTTKLSLMIKIDSIYVSRLIQILDWPKTSSLSAGCKSMRSEAASRQLLLQQIFAQQSLITKGN